LSDVDEFRRNGFVFDVTDAGPADGDVAVLLHGYPENRTSWQAVTPLLTEAGYRVLAPDQRGYSPRARPLRRRDYRMSELVADTLALVDASSADRVHLVGHDWGGGVAWGFAAAHPDRLHTVTSLTTPHPRAMAASMVRSTQLLKSWYMLFFQLPVLPEQAYHPRMQQRLRRTLEKSGLSPDAINRYVTPLTEPDAARAALNWYRGVPLSGSSAGRIRVPTLYVYPTEDAFLGRKAADLTAGYVDAPYRYEVLQGRSHWLPEEAPKDIAELMLDHFGTR
jgi:pimeloyl-ACP methyl ester carboxylesterase